VPRFLCFARAGDLPAVSVAALRAEAFLVRPAWLRRLLPDGERRERRGGG
jgi:lysyl-tRNA synthetase class 2